MELVLGRGDGQTTGTVEIEFDFNGQEDGPPALALRITTQLVTLSLSRELCTPVSLNRSDTEWQVTPQEGNVVVSFPCTIVVQFDGNDWSLDLEPETELTLPLCSVGQTGVVLKASGVSLNFGGKGRRPGGSSSDWRGIFLEEIELYLPSFFSGQISGRDFGIGAGGLYGTVTTTFPPVDTDSPSLLILGIEATLKKVALTFVQSVPVECTVNAQVLVPFFDEGIELSVGFDAAGNLTVSLGASEGPAILEKAGVLRFSLEGLTCTVQEGVFTLSLSGEVTPLFGAKQGLTWPTFRVRELTIDSRGRVRLEGGWMRLPEQHTLNLYGFQLEISELGFGRTGDGGRWMGFSGRLRLVDGLSAGVSVEGLRVTWYDGEDRAPKLTLNGIGVELEIPDVLRFKGSVSFRELPDNMARFDGSIKLDLVALGVHLDATLVIATQGDSIFMAIHLATELPAGLPLWSTGLAMYGFQGLFAMQMEPDRRSDEAWYAVGGQRSWYHRDTVGVTDLKKWRPQRGSLALGAGVTIGTLADNGYAFSGRFLLTLIFPGPLLMIEGQANLLRERAKLGEEPMFRALAVLDNRVGTFLVGLDAQYRYGAAGELIDIRGSAEAFFSLSDGNAWHLHLGKREPRDMRIRAHLLRLFEANTYFMLDSRRLAMGGWIGYSRNWRFGPLAVELEGWIEGNSVLSWKPNHLSGDLWLHGHVGLAALGFKVSATVDARLKVDAFTPFHVSGNFGVQIALPWPLRRIRANVKVEWGPRETPPPLPLPLKEVALEHFKVTTSWPLTRGSLLQPALSPDNGYLPASLPPVDLTAPPPVADSIPIVPLDGRPHLTFGRPVHDRAAVGINPQPVIPDWERIGDPGLDRGPVRARYGLEEVALDRWDKESERWAPVASSPATPDVPRLFGSWAPVPALPGGETAPGSAPPVGQVKLWLWSRTPFDYTRHSGRAWDDWFTKALTRYPCLPPVPERRVCCSFEDMELGSINLPLVCKHAPGLSLAGDQQVLIETLNPPVQGNRQGVLVIAGVPLHIRSSNPARRIELLVSGSDEGWTREVDFRQRKAGKGSNPRTESELTFHVSGPAGVLDQETAITRTKWGFGLACSSKVEITLPFNLSADESICTLSNTSRCTVRALDRNKNILDAKVLSGDSKSPQKITLSGSGISQLDILADSAEARHVLSVTFRKTPETWAIGYNSARKSRVYPIRKGEIIVHGPDIAGVELHAKTSSHLVRLCALLDPDPSEVLSREEMTQYLRASLTRWSQTGEVFAAYSTYRLKVVTRVEADSTVAEYRRNEKLTDVAYFRTEGPPGLTRLQPPAAHPTPDTFSSGLDDLSRYVRQTMPETVPRPGVPAILPRPVYRGDDVTVEFNEDYVDLLYRRAGRDLGLYLYDNNNRPVRDSSGGLIVRANRWGYAEQRVLTEGERRWVALVAQGACATLDMSTIPNSRTLTSAGMGLFLNADTLYEARVIPLLLAEDFNALPVGLSASGDQARLGGWIIHDEAPDIPSNWEIQAGGAEGDRVVVQTTITVDATGDFGTLLLRAEAAGDEGHGPDQPQSWTDYRLSAYLRPGTSGRVGLVVRWQGPGTYYRFVCDQTQRQQRLEKVTGGGTVVLQAREAPLEPHRDYLMSMEIYGSTIRVYQDGALMFSATDAGAPVSQGRPGLFTSQHSEARFNDLSIDDLSAGAPVVYRFAFTTSRFMTVTHHLESYQDVSWPAILPTDTDLATLIRSSNSGASPGVAEDQSYRAVANCALGIGATQDLSQVEITAVRTENALLALLVRSPEPIRWDRTDLAVSRADGRAPNVTPPGAIKLIGVSLASTNPDEEAVDLLVRESADLTGFRIDYRGFIGGPGSESSGPDTTADLLAINEFTGELLASLKIIDEGRRGRPSRWEVDHGVLRQTNSTHGGAAGAYDKPGTVALIGDPSWTDYRLQVRLSSDDDDAIGVIIRYQDQNNWYRFSMDRERRYRRLVRCVAGHVEKLWEDQWQFELNREYLVTLDILGSRMTGYLDGTHLFSEGDASVLAGQIGLYCWANNGARFHSLRVQRPDWLPWYSFTSEGHQLEGTRLRVHGGSAGGAPVSIPGATSRFTGSTTIHFLPNGTELRLSAPDGTECHRKEFLPAGRYTPVPVRAFRKADGTGLCLLPVEGSPALPDGRYRLQFTVRRSQGEPAQGNHTLSRGPALGTEVMSLDLGSWPDD
ncbi:hypothetical protein [Deinococcus sp. 23YEL01]|uniref:hypothetical protein n=1 Tax=Deinococcus sp. 23YEL01 TaxID=2745871 RepID=UPI001E45EB3C|nr:hypothetical protein [Deinococcus sp. 23YEL01]MCD0170330.1 hypothetical protein [Deinococcus sp. 23YEL01]